MRYLLPAIGLTLLLTGCGNDNQNTSTTFFSENPAGFLQASPLDPGLPFSTQNGLQPTIVMLNTVHVHGGGREVAGTPFADFEANRRLESKGHAQNNLLPAYPVNPLAVAEAIQASYGALLGRGSTSGGGFSSTVSGTQVNVIFNGFNMASGTVDGSVTFNGGANPLGFASNTTFTSLRVNPAGGRPYVLDGPGTYSSARSTATGLFSTVFGSNATVTDLGSGGTLRYVNMLTNSNTTGTELDSTITQTGRMLFAGYRNLTGAVDVSTPVQLRFEEDVPLSGQWLFTGSGSLRATVIVPSTIEIAAAGPGGQLTTLQTLDYQTIRLTP